MRATQPSRSSTSRSVADMKRYHYRPVEQAPSPRRNWLIPAGLGCLAVGLVTFASIGASRDSDTRSSEAAIVAAEKSDGEVPQEFERIEPKGDVAREAIQRDFRHCGMLRRTCVVDGDTFWLEGDKIRIADIDTPEVSQPQCASEKALGDRATNRLVELLNDGPFEMSAIGGRDEDQYGRKLRVVTRDGRSLGDQLVAEGLARAWTGRREPWC